MGREYNPGTRKVIALAKKEGNLEVPGILKLRS